MICGGPYARAPPLPTPPPPRATPQVMAEHRILSVPVVVPPPGEAAAAPSPQWPADGGFADVLGFVDIRDILCSLVAGVCVCGGGCPCLRVPATPLRYPLVVLCGHVAASTAVWPSLCACVVTGRAMVAGLQGRRRWLVGLQPAAGLRYPGGHWA